MELTRSQIAEQEIVLKHINTTEPGNSLITSIAVTGGLEMEFTGADPGTGSVTIRSKNLEIGIPYEYRFRITAANSLKEIKLSDFIANTGTAPTLSDLQNYVVEISEIKATYSGKSNVNSFAAYAANMVHLRTSIKSGSWLLKDENYHLSGSKILMVWLLRPCSDS